MFNKKNKKGQIGETVTWVVATIIIIVILKTYPKTSDLNILKTLHIYKMAKAKKAKPKKKAKPRKKAAPKKKAVKKPKVAKKQVVKEEKVQGKAVGKITHYFGHINVAVVALTGTLKAGDKIRVKGATTDFEQKVDSMQIEHEPVDSAGKGKAVGLKIKGKVRDNDVVYVL